VRKGDEGLGASVLDCPASVDIGVPHRPECNHPANRRRDAWGASEPGGIDRERMVEELRRRLTQKDRVIAKVTEEFVKTKKNWGALSGGWVPPHCGTLWSTS
jgi:hypothetical protein